MTWTTPATAAATDTLTADFWNEQVRDNLEDLDARVGTSTVQHFGIITTGDVSKTASTYSNVTGLTFAVEDGKSYNLNLVLTYEVAGTSTGLTVGFNHPGGACKAFSTIHGVSSGTSDADEVISATDSGTGTSSANASATVYFIHWTARYVCDTNGTFAVRYARNGTSTTVTIHEGSGGTVVATAA